MKKLIPSLFLSLLVMTILSIFFLTQCIKIYKATPTLVTDTSSLKLLNKCHFVRQEKIEAWTDTFKKYVLNDTSLKFVPKKFISYSTSFNNCITKEILNEPNCIGIRVLYGMKKQNDTIRVILVGISPDYQNLYITKPEWCSVCNGDDQDEAFNYKNPSLISPLAKFDQKLVAAKGGIEMGLKP